MGQTGPVTSLVRKPRTADREDFSTSSPVDQVPTQPGVSEAVMEA